MTEINANLDKAAITVFKEALKKLKFGQLPDIDFFTKEVIITHHHSIILDSLIFLQGVLRFRFVQRRQSCKVKGNLILISKLRNIEKIS